MTAEEIQDGWNSENRDLVKLIWYRNMMMMMGEVEAWDDKGDILVWY